MRAQNKQAIGEIPLHLMTSVRSKAEEISANEGVTLNEFVNVAVAEKLAHYAHAEWVKHRKSPTQAGIAKAQRTLHKKDSRLPQAGDELPEGYVRGTAV